MVLIWIIFKLYINLMFLSKKKDIEKIEVNPERWKQYKIKTSFFKPDDYQKYLIYNIYKILNK